MLWATPKRRYKKPIIGVVNTFNQIVPGHIHLNKVVAAEGGPLALVQEGDSILIDIPNRTLTLEVSEEDIPRRREAWAAPDLKVKVGYLYRYAKVVSSSNTGAILKA